MSEERTAEQILTSIEEKIDRVLARLDQTEGKIDTVTHQFRWKDRSGW